MDNRDVIIAQLMRKVEELQAEVQRLREEAAVE
jgi:hypothetical protein